MYAFVLGRGEKNGRTRLVVLFSSKVNIHSESRPSNNIVNDNLPMNMFCVSLT